MKILMSGPGYGHNIHPWLEYFQNRGEVHKLYFLCNRFEFEREHFRKLEIIETGGSRKQLILQLLGLRDQLFDVLYIHGANNPSHTWLLLHLTKYRISILNLWGNSILDQVQEGKFDIRLLYQLVFGRASYIFLNWYGMKTRFEEYYPNLRDKTVLTPWGLHNDWFQEQLPEASQFTRSFLASIPTTAVVCFWPKSLTRQTRFDLAIEAIGILNQDSPEFLENFILYLWPGNVQDTEYRKELENRIIRLHLGKVIVFCDHPYVPFSDLIHLWRRSNFAMNIAEKDQLSTTILEPMLMGKEILLSDIEPYRILDQKFSLHLDFVENNTQNIAAGLRQMIHNENPTNPELLAYRAQVMRENFHFDQNIDKIMVFLNEKSSL